MDPINEISIRLVEIYSFVIWLVIWSAKLAGLVRLTRLVEIVGFGRIVGFGMIVELTELRD